MATNTDGPLLDHADFMDVVESTLDAQPEHKRDYMKSWLLNAYAAGMRNGWQQAMANRQAFIEHQAASWQAELDDAAIQNAKLRAMIEELNGPHDYS